VTYRTVKEEATMRTLLVAERADMIDQWRLPTTFAELAKTSVVPARIGLDHPAGCPGRRSSAACSRPRS